MYFSSYSESAIVQNPICMPQWMGNIANEQLSIGHGTSPMRIRIPDPRRMAFDRHRSLGCTYRGGATIQKLAETAVYVRFA